MQMLDEDGCTISKDWLKRVDTYAIVMIWYTHRHAVILDARKLEVGPLLSLNQMRRVQ